VAAFARRGMEAGMDTLIDRFERADLTEFPHADHVRVAFGYLEACGADTALPRLAEGLARLAAANGKPQKFHYTLTRAWLELIAAARARYPAAHDADALMQACPALRDPALIDRCYSAALLASPDARTGWLQPDKAPLASTV
jgi:hypothetical protein